MVKRLYHFGLTHLKQSREDVKLKHRDVVIAGEIYS